MNKKFKIIISWLMAVSTIGGFMLVLWGFLEQRIFSPTLEEFPKHVRVTRDVLANVKLDKGLKKERLKISLSDHLPEEFKISYMGSDYDFLWREIWTIENIGTQELTRSSYFEPITAKLPHDYKVVAVTSKELTIVDNGKGLKIEPGLLNPQDKIVTSVIFSSKNSPAKTPNIELSGKLIGSSKIEFKTNDYQRGFSAPVEAQFKDLVRMHQSPLLIWFSGWDIAYYLVIYGFSSFISLYLFHRSNMLKSGVFFCFCMTVLMLLAAAFSEVITYMTLRRYWANSHVILSIWIPVVLFQISIWLYLVKRTDWRRIAAHDSVQ